MPEAITGQIAKCTIEKVTNGYIVRVITTGLSSFKDPYVKPVYVFNAWSEASEFLEAQLVRDGES